MALSGTLDSFALPEVLRLLASTKKTGRLRVTGDRGAGSVWVDNGEIVSTELTPPGWVDPAHAEVLFSLLRFGSGSFTFEAQARTANPSEPEQLESSLVTAEHMLIEWRAIEEIVPSLDVFLELSPELTGTDVMIDAIRWRCIAAVAGGATADSAGATLGLNELEVCRTIKELVELGLLVVGEAPPDAGLGTGAESIGQPDIDIETDAGSEAVAIETDAGSEAVAIETDAGSEAVAIETDAGSEAVDVSSGGDQFDSGSEPETTDVGSEGAATEHGVPEGGVADVGVIGVGDGSAFDAMESVGEPIEESQPYEPADHDTTRDAEPIVTTAPGLAGLGAEMAPNSIPSSDAVVDGPPQTGPTADAEYPIGVVEAEPVGAGGGDPFGAATVEETAASDLDPAEMARQLANLSPQAAKAVAAAAKASTDAERDAALAAVEAEDETVNRGLLLKFLGSVDT